MVSLSIESLAWISIVFMNLVETKVYIKEFRWYVRFGVIYVLVSELVILSFVLSMQSFYSRFTLYIYYSSVICQILYGALLLVHLPHLNPFPGYVPLRSESIDDNNDETILGADHIFPERYATILSRISFGWITPLLRRGYNRPITEKDVWKLDSWDKSETLSARFQRCWAEESQRKKPWLLRALNCSLGGRFWYGGLFKVVSDLCQFVGPLLLNRLLESLERGDPAWIGHLYAFLIFVGVSFGVLCEAQYFQNVMRVGFRMRSTLVTAIFRKSVRLRLEDRKQFPSGKITNMITTDANALQQVCQQLHVLWSAPFRIVIAVVLLYQQLGLASLLGALMLILMIPIQTIIVSYMRKLSKEGLQYTDKRVGLTNEVLAAMDVVKCYAWEKSFQSKVQGMRNGELSWFRKAQLLAAFNNFMLNSIPVLVTVISFGCFTLLGGNLTAARAFSSLSLFAILRFPLNMLPNIITQVVNSNISLQRMEELFLAEERVLLPNPPLEPGFPAISIRGGFFSWDSKPEHPTLSNINFDIPVGELVAIVGGTGEGKTSLISAILGELPPLGNASVTIRGSIAYVPQVSWIFNATVRENILFGSNFESTRYWKAIDVTALDHDLDLLPGRDLTEIGERGVNISEGQKQRVSMARAVYKNSDVYIFDDPLSALDAHVAHQVFKNCIKEELQGKTRVLVTNQLHFLPQVDRIILVSEGMVKEDGTFEKLLEHGTLFPKLMENAGKTESYGSETEYGPNFDNERSQSSNIMHELLKDVTSATKRKAGKSVLIRQEERETGIINWNVLMRYKDALGGLWVVLILFVCYTLTETLRVLSSTWLSVWTKESSSKSERAGFYILVYATLSFSQVIVTLANSFWLIISSLNAAKRLHDSMLHSILRAPMVFFQTNPSGRIINRFAKDLGDIDRNVANIGNMCLGQLWQLLSTFVLIGVVSTISLWAIMPLLILFYAAYSYYQELGTGRTIATGRVQDGLYYLDSNLPHSSAHVTQTQSISLLHQWHQRLGHPSFRVLSSLFPSLAKSCTHETFVCDVCELSKHTRANYPLSLNKSDVPFSIIHSDLWVCRHTSIDGFKYFVTFIDNCTRLTCVYLLRTKNEVFSCFRSYHAMIRTQFNAKVQIFRSDNGTEYIDGNFRSYLDEHGILPQTSCVGTPQQNGIPERKNRHLLNVTRSIMFSMHVPKTYWSHAVTTAGYLINQVPSPVLDFKTPISLLPKSSLPTSLPLRVFGCVCFVHNSNPSRDKLDPRALRCVFLGYSTSQKGYKCYHPPTRKMFITMDVTFRETEAYFPPSLQGEPSGEEMSRGFEQSFSFPFPLPSVPLVLSEEKGEISSQSQAEASREKENPFIPQKDFGIVYARKNQIPREQSIQVPPRQSPPFPVPDPGNDTLESVPHVENSDIPIALRKGVRTCTKYPIANFMSYEKISPPYRAFLSSLSSVSIPQSWKEAAMNPKWKEAMNEEMRALKKNETWELVQLPAGKKTVGCKWVFTVKQNADGIIERFKARLVAKGFTQTYGVDYQETFAPVAKMDSIRALLSCAANLGWSLHQLDVKNAYLHGNLEEEVYMDIPPGFSSQITDGKVCRLKKALYGLKQSPRAWFGRFLHAMLKIGYKQSHADHTMFVRREGEKITVLIVYVDDIVVTGNHEAEISQLKSLLAKEFEIKDLGPLKYFLGIEVAQSKSGIFISQRKYVLDLLAESGMLGCKPANSPIEANHHLCGGVGEPADRGRYQRLVGRLIYLAHTRPDIAYAVSVVSRYMHDPRIVHQDAVYRILRYLKSTPGNGILFSNHGHLTLECFTDADWAGSKDDRKSTTGYCTLLGGNLVTWKSKKQSVVSRSSAEAEYRAMAKGTCELIWLKSLLGDLGVMHERPMRLYCDNQAAINIAHNPVQHDRTKHIEVDRNFIKEKLDQKLICTPYVKSK